MSRRPRCSCSPGIALGALGAILVINGIVALARARPLRFALRTLPGCC
jgi:hypothetical protein